MDDLLREYVVRCARIHAMLDAARTVSALMADVKMEDWDGVRMAHAALLRMSEEESDAARRAFQAVLDDLHKHLPASFHI